MLVSNNIWVRKGKIFQFEEKKTFFWKIHGNLGIEVPGAAKNDLSSGGAHGHLQRVHLFRGVGVLSFLTEIKDTQHAPHGYGPQITRGSVEHTQLLFFFICSKHLEP